MESVVIKGGKVVTPKETVNAGLAIKERKIAAIAKGPHLPRAGRETTGESRFGEFVPMRMEG
ncbi:MAG: hypothetical protein ACE5OW_03890 [Candidatus Bathyarchaeia archaeon]